MILDNLINSIWKFKAIDESSEYEYTLLSIFVEHSHLMVLYLLNRLDLRGLTHLIRFLQLLFADCVSYCLSRDLILLREWDWASYRICHVDSINEIWFFVLIWRKEPFLVIKILFELFFAVLERSRSTYNKEVNSIAHFSNDHLVPFDTVWESQLI